MGVEGVLLPCVCAPSFPAAHGAQPHVFRTLQSRQAAFQANECVAAASTRRADNAALTTTSLPRCLFPFTFANVHDGHEKDVGFEARRRLQVRHGVGKRGAQRGKVAERDDMAVRQHSLAAGGGGGHENTSEKAFQISGEGARGGRKKKEEEQATASGARCGGSKLIAGTVFAAQSFATWPTAAAAAQPDATGGSGRGIPTIPVLFEPERGGRCCRGHKCQNEVP